MPRALIYAVSAVADLNAARQWLTQSGSGITAKRRLTAIFSAIERLRETPCRHAPSRHVGLRKLTCQSYVMLHKTNPDTGRNESSGDVQIMRVFGSGQSRNIL